MLLDGLNPVQKDAVSAIDGPILVVAGAGSGKTRVLTHRIANLIENHDIFPSSILAITFTNKAASEMKSRIEQIVGSVSNQMWVGTFHAICVRILRAHGSKIGYDRDFVIYDTVDQKSLLKKCYQRLNIDEKTKPLKKYQFKISSAKNDMLTPEQYAKENESDFREKEFIKVYELYQKLLKENQAMDFDDLLLKVIELFKKCPDVLSYYQDKFKYIHVDEYQDTNRAQYTLIQLMSSKHRNLFVVGDGDQSIYRWRGADVRNIQEFERDYSGAQIFKLEQNYRSSENILSLANSVIQHNPDRRKKVLWTDRGEGEKIKYYQAYDEKDEARYVVEEIQRRKDEGYKLSDFAILYRTNAQSRAFEDALMYRGINYRVIGGAKFYDRKEIKDIMAYFKLLINPFDNVSFERVINEPKRSIGAKSVEKIESFAILNGISLLAACNEVSRIVGLSSKAKKGVEDFAQIFNTIVPMLESDFMTNIFDALMLKSGIIDTYQLERTDEADARIENIYEFRTVIEEFEKRSETGHLRDFLAETSLRSDQDGIDDTQEGALLMTLHASKGLEFPVVFMVGLEDQLFPSFRSLDDDEALQEERRLCYVGITRAEDILYVTHAKNRNQFGRYEAKVPSQFLQEMDISLMDGITKPDHKLAFSKNNKKKPSFFEIKRQNQDLEKNKKSIFLDQSERKIETKQNKAWSTGEKVVHKIFGEGLIVGVSSDGNQLTIVFNQQGMKKLSADIAPLKKVGV